MKINTPFDIKINKKLIWKYDLGYSIVKYKGLDKDYIIHLHPLQMFILMFLNEGEYSLEDLIKKSNMNSELIIYILNIFIQKNIVIQNYDKYKQNKLFLNDNQKIYLYEKIDEKILYAVVEEKEYNYEYKFSKYNKLIIEYIKDKILETELIKKIKEKLDFDFKLNEFITVILTNIKNKKICRINDREIYYNKL